jgi:hypothetical protein
MGRCTGLLTPRGWFVCCGETSVVGLFQKLFSDKKNPQKPGVSHASSRLLKLDALCENQQVTWVIKKQWKASCVAWKPGTGILDTWWFWNLEIYCQRHTENMFEGFRGALGYHTDHFIVCSNFNCWTTKILNCFKWAQALAGWWSSWR